MNKINTKEIFHQYKILEELHGSLDEDCLIKNLANFLHISENKVRDSIRDIDDHISDEKEYGLVIGRWQPFHYGHQHIINEVLLDGKIPLIALGDDNGADFSKNPLSITERQILIKLIYPNTKIEFISARDNTDWTKWWEDLMLQISDVSESLDQVTLYYNNKEVDRHDNFECLGKEYINEFYTQIFEDNDIKTRQVEFVERTDIVVDADARNIRDNFEDFSHLLDARVYWKLKEWGW